LPPLSQWQVILSLPGNGYAPGASPLALAALISRLSGSRLAGVGSRGP
jgi:hypothetical protein